MHQSHIHSRCSHLFIDILLRADGHFVSHDAPFYISAAVRPKQFHILCSGTPQKLLTMVLCAAKGCSNRTDRDLARKKAFYSIPNPKTHPEKIELAAKWLHNIGTGWTVENYKFASYKRVCEIHFEASCFDDNHDMHSRLMRGMGYQTSKRRKLKSDAVPTIFSFKQESQYDSHAKRADNCKDTSLQVSSLSDLTEKGISV